MIEEKENKFEILLRRVGGENKYQYLIFFIFAVQWVIAAMILFSLNFFYIVPEFKCTDSQMVGYDSCEKYVCSSDDQNFWYDHFQKPIKPSISLDYGVYMVCSKQWISSLLQSICYLGSLFGYIIMPYIGDNYGRLKGEYISWIICIIGEVIMLLSVNVFMIGMGGFLLGFGANAAITLHYSFFKQLVIGETRQRMIIAIQLAFSLGISLISLLSYIFDTWKITLAFFILTPSVLIIFAFRLVEQTPEFTLKKGLQTFKQSFNRIARFNNNEQLEIDQIQKILSNQTTFSEKEVVSLLNLFEYPSLRYITIITGLINLTIEFVYDGTILGLGKFGINVYFDQILVGFVEIFAAIFGSYIIPKVKRKKYITIAFTFIAILTAIMGVQSLIYNHTENDISLHAILEMLLLALIRFLISSVWGIFFVFVSEMFPIQVSSLSFGWISTAGTIGASIAPYIRLATANLTMFVMSFASLGIIIAVRTLKQTKGLPIQTKIKERQNVQKQSIIEDQQ